MGSDLDRRCAKQVSDLEDQIARYDAFLDKRRRRLTLASVNRVQDVRAYRDSLVVSLFDMKRAHDVYDRRLEDARDDPTGQDLDAFYGSYGEGDEPQRWEE